MDVKFFFWVVVIMIICGVLCSFFRVVVGGIGVVFLCL